MSFINLNCCKSADVASPQIKFPASEKSEYGFPVIANPVRHAEAAATARNYWGHRFKVTGDPRNCVPDVNGEWHNGKGPFYECENWTEADDGSGEGCGFEARHLTEVYAETLEWTPTLLDHYWDQGIKEAGTRFLENGKFVVSYE